ncbi:MAG: TIGR03435 family protein [Acidobacteriota bacterium]
MKFQVAPFILLAAIAAGQTQPSFEVASIKPSDPNPSNVMWIGMDSSDGMLHLTNITLRDCIRTAYRVRDFQVEGPNWIQDARFEIAAKLGTGTPDQIPEMLQSLLEERFKLSLRRGEKDQSVYALVVGKDGPKLQPGDAKAASERSTALGPDGRPRPGMTYSMAPFGIELQAPSASLPTVVEFLSRFMDRPVVDMTGLAGQYNLTLAFVPEKMGANSGVTFTEPGPTLYEAVQQYGLKLEARKAPLPLLTVIHAEKTPTEN